MTFPSTPTAGNTYTTVSGETYTYTSAGYWAALTSNAIPQATTSSIGGAALATQALADLGVDPLTIITPAVLKQYLIDNGFTTTFTPFGTGVNSIAFSPIEISYYQIVPTAVGYVVGTTTATGANLSTGSGIAGVSVQPSALNGSGSYGAVNGVLTGTWLLVGFAITQSTSIVCQSILVWQRTA